MELFQEGFHCGFELAVYPVQLFAGVVVDLYVRIELLVFQGLAIDIKAGDLRYAEDDGRVDLLLPPYGGHCARHGCSHQFADLQRLVGVGCAMGVAIVGFVGEHHRGLGPL